LNKGHAIFAKTILTRNIMSVIVTKFRIVKTGWPTHDVLRLFLGNFTQNPYIYIVTPTFCMNYQFYPFTNKTFQFFFVTKHLLVSQLAHPFRRKIVQKMVSKFLFCWVFIKFPGFQASSRLFVVIVWWVCCLWSLFFGLHIIIVSWTFYWILFVGLFDYCFLSCLKLIKGNHQTREGFQNQPSLKDLG